MAVFELWLGDRKTSCFGLKHLLIILEFHTTYKASVCDEFEMRLEISLSYKPDHENFKMYVSRAFFFGLK